MIFSSLDEFGYIQTVVFFNKNSSLQPSKLEFGAYQIAVWSCAN